MNKTDLNDEQRKAYRELFVNRYNAYMLQNAKGIPSKVESELTDEILFDPNKNVGSYQLDKSNKVKYAALDIDLDRKVYKKPDFKLDNWLPKLQAQAKRAYYLLKARDINSIIEFSGFKGYHLWIFFDELVDAGIAKEFMHSLFDEMLQVDDAIEWEIFPKQAELKVDDKGEVTGYGNYIKPPLQIHKKSGKWSYFVNENFNKISVDLINVPKTKISQIKLETTANEQDNSTIAATQTPGKRPTNLKNIFDKCSKLEEIRQSALSDGLVGIPGHEKRLALASILKPFGNEGYDELIKILSNVSDFNEKKTKQQWDSVIDCYFNK